MFSMVISPLQPASVHTLTLLRWVAKFRKFSAEALGRQPLIGTTLGADLVLRCTLTPCWSYRRLTCVCGPVGRTVRLTLVDG